MNWKSAALALAEKTRLLSAFRRFYSHGALILMFHRFCKDGGPGMTQASLRDCLSYLREHFEVVPLRQLADAMQLRKPLRSTVALTIDDGYRDFVEIAVPLLREYGMPATWFVTAEFVNGSIWLWPDRVEYAFRFSPKDRVVVRVDEQEWVVELGTPDGRQNLAAMWVNRMKRLSNATRVEVLERLPEALQVELPESPTEEYRPASWAEIEEALRAGVEIGSHTMTHPILARMSDREANWEIAASKALIEEKIRGPVTSFCYPNGQRGDYTDANVAAVRQAGYHCATSSILDLNRPGGSLFELFRYGAPENDLLRFKQTVTGLEDFKRRLRRGFAG